MALTKVQVISNALTILGFQPVISLESQQPIVAAAEQAFDFLLPSCLSQQLWRFAVQIQQLSLSVDTPLPPNYQYQYIYDLPPDFLKTVRLYPQSYDWQIYQNAQLYCNFVAPIYLEYVFLPVYQNIPNHFWHWFVFELAGYLALSSAQKPSFYPVIQQKGEWQRAISMAIDAQNSPSTPLISHPMLDVRTVAVAVQG